MWRGRDHEQHKQVAFALLFVSANKKQVENGGQYGGREVREDLAAKLTSELKDWREVASGHLGRNPPGQRKEVTEPWCIRPARPPGALAVPEAASEFHAATGRGAEDQGGPCTDCHSPRE